MPVYNVTTREAASLRGEEEEITSDEEMRERMSVVRHEDEKRIRRQETRERGREREREKRRELGDKESLRCTNVNTDV